MSRIYVASSWRNPYQPNVVEALLTWGHAVYDFRRDCRIDVDVPHAAGFLKDRLPPPIDGGTPPATQFAWSDIDPKWKEWKPSTYRECLMTARACQGYVGDLRGMEWADTCVLCLPAGNSAHIEAGYMKAKGKRLIIYWQSDYRSVSAEQTDPKTGETTGFKKWDFEPDLMYLLADNLCIGEAELRKCLTLGMNGK